MANQIISASGTQFGMLVNSDGSINIGTSAPNSGYNPKLVIVYSGTAIGSIYSETTTGSYLQVLKYNANDDITQVSPWSVV